MAIEYGRCGCSGTIVSRMVEISFDSAQVLRDVSQGVCQLCGSRYYKTDALIQIEALMRGRDAKDVRLDQADGLL